MCAGSCWQKQKVNRELHCNNRSIQVTIHDTKSVELRFPKTYKHVGTKLGASLNDEVFGRCAIMQSSVKPLKKKALTNMHIPVEKRLAVSVCIYLPRAPFRVQLGPI